MGKYLCILQDFLTNSNLLTSKILAWRDPAFGLPQGGLIIAPGSACISQNSNFPQSEDSDGQSLHGLGMSFWIYCAIIWSCSAVKPQIDFLSPPNFTYPQVRLPW